MLFTSAHNGAFVQLPPTKKPTSVGLFCAWWTPEGWGLVRQGKSEGFYAKPSLEACHPPSARKVPAWNFDDFRGSEYRGYAFT